MMASPMRWIRRAFVEPGIPGGLPAMITTRSPSLTRPVLSSWLGGNPSDLSDKLRSLLDRQKKLERELEAIKAKAASGATSDLAASAAEIQGVKVIATRLEGFDAKALRGQLARRLQVTVGFALEIIVHPS